MSFNIVLVFFFTSAGRLSPFILLTLREPLDGIEGTLFRSLLELDCHKNPETAKPLVPLEEDGFPGLTDLSSYVLPVADSIQLIRGTGLDCHLLSLLGLDNADPSRNLDQDDLLSDTDQNQTVLIEVAGDSKKGALGLESVAVSQIQVQTEEDQKDQMLKAPSEVCSSFFEKSPIIPILRFLCFHSGLQANTVNIPKKNIQVSRKQRI